MVYKWRTGCRFPVNAQTAGETLEAIRETHGGSVTPAQVVEAARPVDSALHRCFEWNQCKAAQRWNEHQARGLLAAIVEVHIEPETQIMRETLAYVSVRPPESGQRSYHSTSRVVSDAELYRQAVDEALALLNGIRNRFAHISELAEVFRTIDLSTQRMKPKPRKRTRKAVETVRP